MASIKTYTAKSGDRSYTVVWRAGGSRAGDWQSELFDELNPAERFRDLVNGHGQQWPPGWVKGEGFVEPGESPAPNSEKFPVYAHAFVRLLTDISDHTRTNYTKFIDNHMIPWFGELSVSDRGAKLTRDHVSEWILDLHKGRPGPLHPPGTVRRAYAPKTIANLHGLLFSILQSAVEADPALRDSNPCAHTRLPKGNDTEDDEVFLEPEEYDLLRAHLRADALDIVDALVSTGLRWGEATALQPRDFTFTSKRSTLRVQRAWKRRGEGGTFLGAPKTKKSRRTLVLTPDQVQMFQRRCLGKKSSDLIFTAPEGGAWHSGVFHAHRWKPALDAANLAGLTKRPRIHDLRHTHASWLIAGKVPLPVIQGRLGHESITTTVDRYGHLLESSDAEVVAAVEWAMNSTTLLPTFPKQPALAPTTGSFPQVPRQSSTLAQTTWKDASDVPLEPADQGDGPVFVVTLGGREVPFASRQHAQEVADQWNDDNEDAAVVMRADGWPEEQIARHGALGPEERERWAGGGAVWTRIPERRFVYSALASYEVDGTLTYAPHSMGSRWTWEFEPDGFTTLASEFRTEFRPHGNTEAHARGVTRSAVVRAFEQACMEALEVCHPPPTPAGQHAGMTN